MKDNELNITQTADAELDAALAQMADEVPPMPADFHEKWMNAVRAEARNTADNTEKAISNKTISLARRTRILSAAAAFVFLIGGTLLYRNSKRTLSPSWQAEKREAAETAAEAPAEETAALPETAMEAEEPEAAYEAYEAAEEPMAEAAYTEDADMMAEGEEAAEVNAKGAYDLTMHAFAAAPQNEEAPVQDAGGATEAAGEAGEAYLPPATSAPTEIPEAEAEPADKPAEESGFFRKAGAFFADMGDFLLAALPYLLVLAVPAAAALIIRRRKNS